MKAQVLLTKIHIGQEISSFLHSLSSTLDKKNPLNAINTGSFLKLVTLLRLIYNRCAISFSNITFYQFIT